MKTLTICAVIALSAGASRHAFSRGNPAIETGGSGKSISLSIGVTQYNQLDKYLSPYVFGGTLFCSDAEYRVRSGENTQRIGLFACLGALGSSVQSRDVYQDVGLLSYSFVHALGRWDVLGAPLEMSLGGGISSLVMNTDFNIVDNLSAITIYDQSWYWHHSLNLIIAGEYMPGIGSTLAVRLTAPLLGLVSRPGNGHWLNDANDDVIHNFGSAAIQGKLEPFWKAPVLFAAVEYVHSLAERLNIRGRYSFSYVASNRPAEILSLGMYMNSALVGLEWVI